MDNLKFEISEEISFSKIKNILDVLNNTYKEATISIHLSSNSGGNVDSAIQLIEAIKNTQAHVVLSASRYVISAAAFIYLWFLLYKENHVTVKLPDKPALLVYHRPRIQIDNNYIAFFDDLSEDHNLLDELKEATQLFDELFNSFVISLGYTINIETYRTIDNSTFKHELKHIYDAYYSNQDVVIPLL